MKKRDNLAKYDRHNNASFAVEVEEFAKWAETIFKDYSDIVGIENAKNEITPYWTELGREYADFYEDEEGLIMPKVIWNRRSHLCLLKPFTGLKNKAAIEILIIKYELPTNEQMRFDKSANGLNGIFNVYAVMNENYYSDVSRILLLVVYRSLKQRGYNLGKSKIANDDITEYKQIMNVIRRHPWLSGEFRRYG